MTKKQKDTKNLIKKIALYIIMSLLGIILVIPFLWTISSSLKDPLENISETFMLFPAGPPWEWSWSNYSDAIDYMNYWRAFANTLIIMIPKLLGDVFMSAFVAYGFARFNFPGKSIIFLILLGSLIVPFEVTLIPMYIIFSTIGWIDTYLPLIVPALFGSAQFIFFLTMYFISMPKELVEAAKMDGLNEVNIWRKLYLPISVPALVVVAIWSFQGTWNDLLGPLIWLNTPEKFTLTLTLTSMTTATSAPPPEGVVMAATILVMLPVLIVFLALQKYILDPSKSSGIKG